MKCPNCGHAVTQEEAFCGQCGYSASTMPPQPRLTYNSGMLGSTYPQGPQQQTGFYHDATEAISLAPSSTKSQALPQAYPQQGFAGSMMPSPSYMAQGQPSTQAGPQTYPYQTGNYNGPMPAQQNSFATGQGYNYYGMRGPGSIPPQKQSGNTIILVVCITLVVVLMAAATITTFVLINHSAANQTAVATPAAAATSSTAITPSPTSAPSPTPEPSPTPIPSPTAIPTAVPDAGFAWCDTNCNQYGFMTEFPTGWLGAPPANSQGVQFTDPTKTEVSASFKALGATASSANDVLMNDLQTNFASQPNYTQPTPPPSPNATIGGVLWSEVVGSYSDNQGQPVHIEVYATVYQSKAYIIELQAPYDNGQFDTLKQQFFANMLAKFQFQSAAQ